MDINYDLKINDNLSIENIGSAFFDNAFTKLLYVKNGGCKMLFNDKEYYASEGETVLIPAFSTIDFISEENNNGSFSLFSYFLLNSEISFVNCCELVKLDSHSKLSNSLEQYFSVHVYTSITDQLLKKSLEYYIIYFSEAYFNSEKISLPQKMLPLISYIEKNYGQNFSISDLAKSARISESSVYKLFTLYLNESPKQYLRKRRMIHATNMLINTKKSISDISIETGFYDQYYFSKEFKKDYGISPSIYRKQKNN